MPLSPLVLAALEQRKLLRTEYELRLEAEYSSASEWCRGDMLNDRGRADDRVTGPSLFMGPRARVEAYASPALLEYWQTHPRVTFAMFEAEYVAALYGGATGQLWTAAS